MKASFGFVEADWPSPPGIRAFTTTRMGGFSRGPWASFNLGAHCGDDPRAASQNRQRLRQALPSDIRWMHQDHGVGVQALDGDSATAVHADAQWTVTPDRVCAVLTADCLPVLFCSQQGDVVAAAHAGWRGLADGILEATLAAMPSRHYLAWLGPAIGANVYEVRDDVVSRFPGDEAIGFRRHRDRWLMDIYALARARLQRAGVASVHGGCYCTGSDTERFFSYRRDGQTGRMATVIWRSSNG